MALALSVFGAPPALSQTADDQTLAFGCADLVVIGRVENVVFHSVDNPDEVLGHGWVDARLIVRRVVQGNGIGHTMLVRYFAQTYMRDDRDFMFVLSQQPDGLLVIKSGQLMSAHPKLASRCS